METRWIFYIGLMVKMEHIHGNWETRPWRDIVYALDGETVAYGMLQSLLPVLGYSLLVKV